MVNRGEEKVRVHMNVTRHNIHMYPYYLKPLVHKTASFIKDTTHFLNELDQLGHLSSNATLVTLDVPSLYTNIPHNEGIDACRHNLSTRDQSTSTVRPETMSIFSYRYRYGWKTGHSFLPSVLPLIPVNFFLNPLTSI